MIDNTIKTFEISFDDIGRHHLLNKNELGNSLLSDMEGHSSNPHACINWYTMISWYSTISCSSSTCVGYCIGHRTEAPLSRSRVYPHLDYLQHVSGPDCCAWW